MKPKPEGRGLDRPLRVLADINYDLSLLLHKVICCLKTLEKRFEKFNFRITYIVTQQL